MSTRVVLDTNVFFSAYGYGGKPARLVAAALDEEFELMTSPAIMAELARVLATGLGADVDRIRSVVVQVTRSAVVIRPATKRDAVIDESDNRILECAVDGGADLIVSGDRHLLRLGEFRGIEIVTVAEALDRLGIGGDES
jgi:putative PIN family toxin of toxin-antitoxin system